MPSAQPKYDVAISFLSQDEQIGAALCDRLSANLKVFFYPRKQEELAGTDGLESLRLPFNSESRVVVVLYRDRWGQTPWTRVEETAIKDRCLSQGWSFLLFVTLERTSTLPIWLPQTHIRLSYPEYGLEQTIGAIKARVQECGGEIARADAVAEAAIVQREARVLAAKQALLTSPQGIERVKVEMGAAFTEIERLCSDLSTKLGMTVLVGSDQSKCVMTDGHVSVIASWQQQYANNLTEAGLRVAEFDGRLALPSERLMYVFDQPTKLKEIRFTPDLSQAMEFRWADSGKRLLTSADLANRCVSLFVQLVRRRNEGKVGQAQR